MNKGKDIRHRPYLYSIRDMFETKNGTLTVIDRFRIQREDQVYRKHYTVQCARGHQYAVDEGHMKKMATCKMCEHPPIIETDPDFAKWFADSRIPREKTRYSHFNADFYCQNCGKIVKNKSIHTIYQRRKVPCPYCSDGISYPERYIGGLLDQMKVKHERQYVLRFQTENRSSHYKYDFYDKERSIIIETHGPQRYVPGTFEKMGGYTLEQIKERDLDKKQLAVKNLGVRYIELDCRKSDANWIKNEVIRKLDMYPLETVDWKKLHMDIRRSLVVQLIELSKQGYTQKQIGEIVHLSEGNVNQKLQQAIRDGLFDGITPRVLRVEENRKIQEKKREKFLQEKQRRERQKQELEKRRLGNIKDNRRHSYTQLLEEIQNKGQKFVVLDEYVNTRTSLRFQCSGCHQIFRRTPRFITDEGVCPFCKKMDEIKERSREKFGSEYEIMGIYTDHKTPIHIVHKTCGKEFWKTPQNFLEKGCPECAEKRRIEKRRIEKRRDHICMSPRKKKSHQEFVKQVYELAGEEYSVMSEYQGASVRVKMRHNVCGLKYMVLPAHFTSTGRRCPFCSKSRKIGSENGGHSQEENFLFMQKVHQDWEKRQQGEDAPAYTDYVWNKKLEDVRAYREEYGNIDIPYGHMVNGYNLGSWITEQRKSYRLNRLQQYKIDALNALGMKWNYLEENWFNMYQQVKDCPQLQDNGYLTLHGTKEERKLFYWLCDQTERYRKGLLSAEKEACMEAIGVRKEYKSDLHFDIMCGKLQKFKEIHGHCIVPKDEGKGEVEPLGLWTARMRRQLSSGQLNEERVARLREIGLPVNNKEAKFQYGYWLAESYRKENGDLKIPQSYVKDGYHLGRWINRMRVEYARGKLSADRIKLLEDIGMVWKIMDIL